MTEKRNPPIGNVFSAMRSEFEPWQPSQLGYLGGPYGFSRLAI